MAENRWETEADFVAHYPRHRSDKDIVINGPSLIKDKLPSQASRGSWSNRSYLATVSEASLKFTPEKKSSFAVSLLITPLSR